MPIAPIAAMTFSTYAHRRPLPAIVRRKRTERPSAATTTQYTCTRGNSIDIVC